MLIAERGAHVVEIAHGDARRVVARIARQRGQTLAHRCVQLLRIEHDELGVVRQRAVQPVGAPRAALIDQHQVAVAPDACERRRDAQIEIAGRLSGTAAQDEQRIGGGLQAQRRDDGDVQLQFFALRVVAIFPHAVLTAASRDAAAGQRALQAAVGRAAAARPANAAPIALQNIHATSQGTCDRMRCPVS